MTIFTPEMRQKAAETRAANKEEDLAHQRRETVIIDGYTIQPAIGHGAHGVNVGFELIPPKDGRVWYLATKQECIDSVPRHKARVA